MRGLRGLFVAGAVVLAVLTTGTAALAQAVAPYPPGASAQCDTSTAAPGSDVTCSASGFAPNSTVTVEVLGNGFSRTLSVTADAQGVASATFQIPADANDGQASVTFTGQDASGTFVRVAAATFTVQEAPGGAGPTTAATGAYLSNGALLGLGAIVIGGSALLLTRRRRHADEEPTV